MSKRGLAGRDRLHVIKASAGSGKTHRLTGEYLHLLFAKPNNHRHILAVTFTNKATDEMKSRIVEELYRLASGGTSTFLNDLTQSFLLNEAQARGRARSILEAILHDYSAFSVSTIDRFFQQTLRAFTRESGLTGGYAVELDEESLLTEAVDLMFSELNLPENRTLSAWLLQFMQANIEEGRSWKVDRQVVTLGMQLFNETYKSLAKETQWSLANKEQLEGYRKELYRIVTNYESKLKEAGKRGVELIKAHGLQPSDFRGGARSQFYRFERYASGELPDITQTFLSFADNLEGWYTKKTGPAVVASITEAYHGGLNDVVKEIIYLHENNVPYNSAISILQNFYTLGILTDIKNRLQTLQRENNVLFLSDTTELLNDMIGEADSPFIYEKTGTRVQHYMMDEFQDTSRMQWENFRPLIDESLASGNFNLIVGDVKQSIYRFRNSDWRLLGEQVNRDFQPESIREHLLDTNWRSDANVVRFNNTFFENAAHHVQNDFNNAVEPLLDKPEASDSIRDSLYSRGPTEEQPHDEGEEKKLNSQIKDAYADVYQQVAPDRSDQEGQVKVTFLKNDRENDWKEEALKRLPLELESLQEQGFALSDIAIVVRWNNEAVQVAETLLAYKEQHPDSPYRYDIISNEALLVGSARSVKAVIALLRHFQNPGDDTRRMMALYEYYRFAHRTTPEKALLKYREKYPGEFPETIREEIERLSTLPFYDMIERFFALTSEAISEKEYTYVQAFLDLALQFKTDASADRNSFLEWWDEKGHKRALFSPEGQDAIRIITIHKSKGLGFGAVIMPFVNWKVDHSPNHTNIIWCKPSVTPFNTIPVLPLKYGKRLENTIFREKYLEEKRLTSIDNLNLLYVAFTRAKHRLIVFAPTPAKPETISDVSDLLWRSIEEAAHTHLGDEGPLLLDDYFMKGEEESLFTYGSASQRQTEPEPSRASTRPLSKRSADTARWYSIPFDERLKLRLDSIGFFSDDGSRDYGKTMHDIISHVKTIADIPYAVERKIAEGELPENERASKVEELTRSLSIREVADWYTGKYTVLNENQLLHPGARISRPDRVMIGEQEIIVADYKFGKSRDSKYNRQVHRYVDTIKAMGHQQVKGFLFYVELGIVEEV
ncbi:MAG: UvrD-helicase domain-containing protein [Bacteroidota bacterium]|jgi:ATP-dependent helicase/nuclease subunit A|nr:UvrD-helicase domain-containing protein [Bacteroidota bacterium]